jgi:dihydroorotate dehydrogenase
MDGVIVTNTTTARTGLRARSQDQSGGLSGLPLFRRSTEMIRKAHSLRDGRLPSIGVGGVFGPQEAKEKLNAGADLIQVFTGLIYRGPGLIREILAAVR